MELTGEARIAADRQSVWEALNDPDVLKAAIPGCEELVKEGNDVFAAKVVLKIGPIKATFDGRVLLSEIDAPFGYVISGEGQGGVAGFAKGKARVRLDEEDAQVTVLRYDVEADVGGKIAQLGSRMLDSTAKRLSGEFFKTFADLVSARHEAGPGAPPAVLEVDQSPKSPARFRAGRVGVGVLMLVGVILIFIYLANR